MKIAYVYDGIYPYSVGGIEKRIWELSTRMSQRGHEVHIFGPNFWDGKSIFEKEGVHVHGVCKPPEQRFINGKRSLGWPIFFSTKVFPALIRERFDIIDCQNFPYFPCFSAKAASFVRRSPLVITWIEAWGDYWLEYLGAKGILGKFVENQTFALSKNIISISKTTTNNLERHIGLNRNIATIPIGIDLDEIAKVEPAGRIYDAVFAGRLVKNKNIDVFIKSIAVLKKGSPKISALIIGDGPEKNALQNLAAEMELEENIKFIGFQAGYENLISHLKSSRVFVLPSTREGFGISVIEANACGLPVIVISDPKNAACELIETGENGFICQLSAENIAEKIAVLLNGNNSEIKMRCINHSSQYDWPTIISSVERFYRSVNSRGG